MDQKQLEELTYFFTTFATPEHVAQSLLKVLGQVDCSKYPDLKNDRDMLVTFVQRLL